MYNDWPEDFPPVTSLIPYSHLRHNADPEIMELYDQAKYHENMEAAVQLIRRLVINEGEEEVMEKIKAISSAHPNAILVPVHAEEGRGKNKIPIALAAFIKEAGNLETDKSIVQTDIVSKTGSKSSWQRLAYRPGFEGDVQQGREYILVDDVFSAGGTFSELRSFIESNGGTVVDTIAMSNGSKSLNPQLGITSERILEIENKYGVESLQQFLKEEKLYDGNHKALTDSEARTILGAASLDEARDRIAEARQKGVDRIRREMVQGESPPIHETQTVDNNSSKTIEQQLNNSNKTGFAQQSVNKTITRGTEMSNKTDSSWKEAIANIDDNALLDINERTMTDDDLQIVDWPNRENEEKIAEARSKVSSAIFFKSSKYEKIEKPGYVQGVCESVAALGEDYTLGKKLLAVMNVTKAEAKKYANPETYKTLEQGIFAQQQTLEKTQGIKR